MRVLVVEDEPDLLRSLAKALREDGYAVDAAQDGEDGLYKAEACDYDAIVLDVMLPRPRRLGAARRLRKTKKTPVLMLTARDAVRDRVRGLDTGADDYLVKPFELAELLARLRALIRRCASQAQSRLRARRRASLTPPRARSPAAANRSRSPRANTPSWNSSPCTAAKW